MNIEDEKITALIAEELKRTEDYVMRHGNDADHKWNAWMSFYDRVAMVRSIMIRADAPKQMIEQADNLAKLAIQKACSYETVVKL